MQHHQYLKTAPTLLMLPPHLRWTRLSVAPLLQNETSLYLTAPPNRPPLSMIHLNQLGSFGKCSQTGEYVLRIYSTVLPLHVVDCPVRNPYPDWTQAQLLDYIELCSPFDLKIQPHGPLALP